MNLQSKNIRYNNLIFEIDMLIYAGIFCFNLVRNV